MTQSWPPPSPRRGPDFDPAPQQSAPTSPAWGDAARDGAEWSGAGEQAPHRAPAGEPVSAWPDPGVTTHGTEAAWPSAAGWSPADPPVVVPQPTPRPQLAVVTWTFIALCTAVYLGEVLVPGFFGQVDLDPVSGGREPWRFLTSAFAHAGLAHIVLNMLALWQVGRILELALGRARYAALYLLSALAGGVCYVWLVHVPTGVRPDDYGVVGASGAVFGLFGALLVLFRRIGVSTRSLWVTLALNVALAFGLPSIAWQSHLGGFLAGIAAGEVLLAAPRKGSNPRRTWILLGAIASLVVVLGVVRYLLWPSS